MTPTLAQLKKRPALWVYVEHLGDYVEPRITMPDNTLWGYEMLDDGWALRKDNPFNLRTWHEFAIKSYEFAGWL